MHQTLITILFFSFFLKTIGQQICVETLTIPKIFESPYKQKGELKFPVLKTGNPHIDKALNMDLKKRITFNAYPYLSTYLTMVLWVENVIQLDYKVTYQKDGLISFSIYYEGCGAYCFDDEMYFNYNYITGKYISIDQILDTSTGLKSMIAIDQKKQFIDKKKILKAILTDKQTGFDRDTYERIIEMCVESTTPFQIEHFALFNGYLKIYDPGGYPNVISDIVPKFEFTFPYEKIKKYMKIKIS